MLLPEWMARPQAAAVEVREIPRLPLESLLSLRAVVDAALALPSFPPPGGQRGETTTANTNRPIHSHGPGARVGTGSPEEAAANDRGTADGNHSGDANRDGGER